MKALKLAEWEAMRERADRRRIARSAVASALAYALALLLLPLLGAPSALALEGSDAPVKVRLGARGVPTDPGKPAASEAPAPSEASPEAETSPEKAAPETDAAPAPAPASTASSEAKPGATSSGAAASSSTSSSAASSSGPPSEAPSGGAATKGEEKARSTGVEYGNSYELAFETGRGNAGRSFGPPIWMYLPLPDYVFDAYYVAIKASSFRSAEENRAVFATAYKFREDGLWHLAFPPKPDGRPAVWAILQAAGYDPGEAPWRSRAVRPVVISFSVTADDSLGRVPPRLASVTVSQSCGDAEIDAAVLYGFQQATFFNRMPEAVSGTFTYRF